MYFTCEMEDPLMKIDFTHELFISHMELKHFQGRDIFKKYGRHIHMILGMFFVACIGNHIKPCRTVHIR